MPTKYPPIVGLNQAITIARGVYKIHNKQRFDVDLLVEVLDTTKTSSYFTRRITAMQQFGLFSRTDETVQLTDLAIQIVDPKAGEDGSARLLAFRKNEVLSDLLVRYPNAKLSSDPKDLKAVLMQSMGIDRDTVELWYDFVIDSFRAISEHAEHKSDASVSAVSQAQPEALITVTKTAMFERQLLPSKKGFEYTLEDGYTLDDLDYIIGLFELKKRTMK